MLKITIRYESNNRFGIWYLIWYFIFTCKENNVLPIIQRLSNIQLKHWESLKVTHSCHVYRKTDNTLEKLHKCTCNGKYITVFRNKKQINKISLDNIWQLSDATKLSHYSPPPIMQKSRWVC